jgi:ArsR family transcriptional regulator, arsenate/arsenite/antimonite-responsive transcriptional repressor
MTPETVAPSTDLPHLEALFKGLADGTRLRILAMLSGRGEVCVCEIHEALGVPQPMVSRHLAYLRRTGLVKGRRQGLWVYYRLARPEDPVLQTILATVTHCLSHVVLPAVPATSAGPVSYACCGGGGYRSPDAC